MAGDDSLLCPTGTLSVSPGKGERVTSVSGRAAGEGWGAVMGGARGGGGDLGEGPPDDVRMGRGMLPFWGDGRVGLSLLRRTKTEVGYQIWLSLDMELVVYRAEIWPCRH